MFQPAPEINEFGIQFVVSAGTVWLINAFKDIGAPAISKWFENNAKLISVCVAFLTAAGFTVSHTGSYMDGGQFVIVHPSVATLITFFTHTGFGSFMQHYMYTVSKADEQNKQIISAQEEFKLRAAAAPAIVAVVTAEPSK